MENGAYYPFAEYPGLQNMTGPGHSMILSGSMPYRTGISLNTWYERSKGKEIYCAEDETTKTVLPGGQFAQGMSPRNFTGTTLGDELKNAGIRSRIISISLKDRAAIFLGGKRADSVLWFDAKYFQWGSSQYYLGSHDLPAWVAKENERIVSEKGNSYLWKGNGERSGLSLQADKSFERSVRIGTKDSLAYPYGLELTNRLVKAATENFQLGKNATPDLLAISYSTHDYLAHAFGPNTQDMEELTVAEDRELSKLLQYFDKQIGLKNMDVVLTADHGVSPSPSWLKTVRIESGRLTGEGFLENLETHVESKLGMPKSGKWFAYVKEFNLYLQEDPEKIEKYEALEAIVKDYIQGLPGVAKVFSKADVLSRRIPPGIWERQILNTYYPGRSGDFIILPKPFFTPQDDPVEHMTGYTYDRTVPLIFTGLNFRKGVHFTRSEIIDIAPTMAAILGVVPPALSEGKVLAEAIK